VRAFDGSALAQLPSATNCKRNGLAIYASPLGAVILSG
jgi:hypothetical protein